MNDIMKKIIPGQAQKLASAYNWIQPYTHVTKVFPHVLTLF